MVQLAAVTSVAMLTPSWALVLGINLALLAWVAVVRVEVTVRVYLWEPPRRRRRKSKK
ncbi:hypothetical protein [Actinomadura mexicana]|uniref:Uncharacterized protein n=1 Tax=Actinomadura mexicana TaxID=134959 RepID=A0A239HQ59_9ACTN|nr:hypothetical protein [Actinomadura mexicana]SNS83073.1 hypothetical protein SAMN06265355_13319 [Actinomadura mexicana]